MQATLVVRWLFLSCSCVVFGGGVDWHKLKSELNYSNDKLVAKQIAENWSERLPDFFEGLGRNSWLEISQHLSPSQINDINRKEFESMTLEVLSSILSWHKVCPTTDTSFWTEERIAHISANCLHDILKEAEGTLKLEKLWTKINPSIIYEFTDEMRPSLRKIDLSDFGFMQPGAIIRILRSVPEFCSALGVKFWTEATIAGITADCLHHILKEAEGTLKLEKLWEKISPSIIYEFTDEMRPSLRKIDLSDFHLMKPYSVNSILKYAPEFCSALGVEFWTEDTISNIPKDCLYHILKEAKGTVRLGSMWAKIDPSIIYEFTDKMRPSLRKIDLSDFGFMQIDIIISILRSVPEFCSALGVKFWTEATIESITADCLHHILKEAKETVKLGSMWKNVPFYCHGLLKKPDFSLDCVHPDDQPLAEDWIKKIIESGPFICQDLSISFWNSRTIKYMTRDCLHNAIDETRRPVALGKLWKHISSVVLKGFIGPWILSRFKNVSGSDFQYMASSVLQPIFSSLYALDYLPQPRSEIVLSTTASEVALDPGQFVGIAKLAPNVAGQLLWYSAKLSKEVLSKCDGEDIRSLSLVVPGGEELDWRGLFARLEKKCSLAGELKRFGQMIQHISQDTENHFCATLDLDEYRSLSWLHPNLSKGCLSKLQFKPDEVSELFRRPELATSSLAWRKMLREYSPSDWALLSQSKIINDLLGGDCEFWGTISGEGYKKVFDALDESIFRSIVPECVLKLTNILRQNAAIIQLLADDAFAKYRVDQLPCCLDSLSPAHISHLSSKLSMDSEQSGQQKASLKITLDELKDLSFEQFKSLYESRWISIERDIKDTALNYQLERVQSQLLATARELKSNSFDQNFNEDLTEDQLNGFRTIEDTLTAVLELYKNNHQEIPEAGLASILTAIKESESWETFVQVFEMSPKLGPAILGLVRDVDGLRYLITEAFDEIGDENNAELMISHDGRSGFDRSGIIDILEKMPELFAAPNARVESQRITDTGGAIRSLANQLLSDIERDLVVPYVKATDYDGAARKAKVDVGMIEISDSEKDLRINSDLVPMKTDGAGVGNSKFAWGVSKQAGLAVGLALGKALQVEIRMPFALDSSFYELLIDTSDRAIETYYKATYSQEVAWYKRNILGLFKTGDLEVLLEIIPRVDSLHFTGLSTKASSEEAKQDIMAKTNLWGCSDKDCYADIKELESEEFVENYIQTILEKTNNEFKEFFRELIRGLEMALPLVKNFSNLPLPTLRPFAEFLPELLNAEPISGEEILARIDFEGNVQIPSLVQGQTVKAKKVFSAFFLTLGTKQLEHLIGLWTGSSTLLLKYSELSVTFMSPGDIESYQVNFCEPGKGKGNHLIASGKEYKEFFGKFSEKLLGAGVTVSPDCRSERAGTIIPVRPSTCAKNLIIYLQPAEQMLNSLVDLLRTPLTTLWDNQ